MKYKSELIFIRHHFDSGTIRYYKNKQKLIKMSSDIYFNVASWFSGNVSVRPHFNTQCPPTLSDFSMNRSGPSSLMALNYYLPHRFIGLLTALNEGRRSIRKLVKGPTRGLKLYASTMVWHLFWMIINICVLTKYLRKIQIQNLGRISYGE